MKTTPLFYGTLAALSGAAFASTPGLAQAQETPPSAPPAIKDVGPQKRPLQTVLNTLYFTEMGARKNNVPGSSGDGFDLVAESSVAQIPVSYPTEGGTITAANVETKLDALLKDLPPGTRWVKLMLPAPPKGKTRRGDDLADFALAQAKLFGGVGEAVLPAGSVEVLSQPLSADKAAQVVPALNLRPIYLIVNPRAHAARTRGMADFADLSPDEQKKWAKNTVPMFLAMSPKERVAAFQNMAGQMTALMEAVTGGMNEAQLKQFFTEMGGEVTDHGATLKIDPTAK